MKLQWSNLANYAESLVFLLEDNDPCQQSSCAYWHRRTKWHWQLFVLVERETKDKSQTHPSSSLETSRGPMFLNVYLFFHCGRLWSA